MAYGLDNFYQDLSGTSSQGCDPHFEKETLLHKAGYDSQDLNQRTLCSMLDGLIQSIPQGERQSFEIWT